MISRSGYNFEKTRAPIAQAAEGYNDWSSTSTAMPSAGPSQGRSDKAAAYSEDMEVDDELGVELAADDLDAEHSYDAFAPGMLPVDDDAQDEDTGRTDRLRAAKDEHLSKAEGKKRAVDPDEDTDDMLDQALAGIGLVPLQTYLSDWESIMAARAKTRAEKDMAAAAAAKAAADGTKKKKNKKKKKGNKAGEGQPSAQAPSAGGHTAYPAKKRSGSSGDKDDGTRIVSDDYVYVEQNGRQGDDEISRKKRKAEFRIDEDASPSMALYEFAQWMEFKKPIFEFKRYPADKVTGTPEGFQGLCWLNDQRFKSKGIFPKKSMARDDVAQDILEQYYKYFNKQESSESGSGSEDESESD